MIYKDCLPATIVEYLAANPNVTSTEIAEGIKVKRARVVDVLPGLLSAGHVIREGRRKQYRYRVPSTGFAPHIPADAPPAPAVISVFAAESETAIADVGRDKETRDAIMRQGDYRPSSRAEIMDAKFAALAQEQAEAMGVEGEEGIQAAEYSGPASGWITTEDEPL